MYTSNVLLTLVNPPMVIKWKTFLHVIINMSGRVRHHSRTASLPWISIVLRLQPPSLLEPRYKVSPCCAKPQLP